MKLKKKKNLIWFNLELLSLSGIPVNYTDVVSIDPEYAKNLQVCILHFLLYDIYMYFFSRLM